MSVSGLPSSTSGSIVLSVRSCNPNMSNTNHKYPPGMVVCPAPASDAWYAAASWPDAVGISLAVDGGGCAQSSLYLPINYPSIYLSIYQISIYLSTYLSISRSVSHHPHHHRQHPHQHPYHHHYHHHRSAVRCSPPSTRLSATSTWKPPLSCRPALR